MKSQATACLILCRAELDDLDATKAAIVQALNTNPPRAERVRLRAEMEKLCRRTVWLHNHIDAHEAGEIPEQEYPTPQTVSAGLN